MTWVKGEPVIYLDERPTHWLAIWKETTMFRDSTLARPLYDTLNGGPPRAWECLLCPHELTDKTVSRNPSNVGYQGRIVTATLSGMRKHLRHRHGIGFPDQSNLPHEPVPKLDGETNTQFCELCKQPLDDGKHMVTLPKAMPDGALAPGHTATDNGIQIDALRSVPEAKK